MYSKQWAVAVPAEAVAAGRFRVAMSTPNKVYHPDAPDSGVGVISRPSEPKLKKPPRYKVLLINDDYTPMEFVVQLLVQFFYMNQEKAAQVMLHVHQKGVGVCGVFPREIAETKVQQVMDCARKNQHPLQCTMEKA